MHVIGISRASCNSTKQTQGTGISRETKMSIHSHIALTEYMSQHTDVSLHIDMNANMHAVLDIGACTFPCTCVLLGACIRDFNNRQSSMSIEALWQQKKGGGERTMITAGCCTMGNGTCIVVPGRCLCRLVHTACMFTSSTSS